MANYRLIYKNRLRLLEKRIADYGVRFSGILPVKKVALTSKSELRPFFIIGAGRSGNTLLRRILNNQSELIIPPENYELINMMRLYRRYSHSKWRDFATLVLARLEYQQDYETYRLGGLTEIAREAFSWPKEHRTLADLLDRFYRYYAEKHKPSASRWGDKTPRNTLGLVEINAIFPCAQYVHIVRDPVDVCHSYVKAGIYSTHKEAAVRWLMSIHAARSFAKRVGNRYMEISYEDLVTSPQSTVSSVCEFLGVEYQLGMENELSVNLGDVEVLEHHQNVRKPISSDSIGKGRRELPAVVIEEIKQVVSAVDV